MIEKKFRDLAARFFEGDTNPTEIVWIAEELQQRRERRDLFIDMAEDFLHPLPISGPEGEPFEPLRALIRRNLSEISDRDLGKAMPTRQKVLSKKKFETPVDEVVYVHGERKRKDTADGLEESKDSSKIGPLIGILIVVVVCFMIAYSSLGDSDRPEEKEGSGGGPVTEATRKLPESTLIRKANELVGGGADSDETANGASLFTGSGQATSYTGRSLIRVNRSDEDDGSFEPLSLSDLVAPTEQAPPRESVETDAGSDEDTHGTE